MQKKEKKLDFKRESNRIFSTVRVRNRFFVDLGIYRKDQIFSQEVCDPQAPLQAPFFQLIHLNQNTDKILLETLTLHCCMCCNPVNGRVDIKEWLAYGTQLSGLE